jgi:tyrosinase
VAAVLKLKAKGAYDQLGKDHRTAMPSMGGRMRMAKMAHRNPWFLPWHREFLLRFERALQKVDDGVRLPYWDWLNDRGKASSLWDEDFMGGSGEGAKQHVATGPFAYEAGDWKLTVQSDGVRDPALRRALGQDGRLPTKAQISGAVERTPYDAAPWDDMERSRPGRGFRPVLEHLVHDPVHMWVGGTMELSTSPNDPVFFLHHANVDRLWAVWERKHGHEKAYLPAREATRFDEDKAMPVLSTKPRQVLSHHALGYRYEVENEP